MVAWDFKQNILHHHSSNYIIASLVSGDCEVMKMHFHINLTHNGQIFNTTGLHSGVHWKATDITSELGVIKPYS